MNIFLNTYLVYLRIRIKILTINSCLLGLIMGRAYIRLNLIKLYYFRHFIDSI